MSVVALLAGVVSPGVAAEAAKTALKELTDGEGGKKVSAEPKRGKAGKKDEDKMDEDAPTHKDPTKNASMSEAHPSTSDSKPSSQTTHTLPHSAVQRAARLALSASAKAASTLATAEEQQIRNTLATLIKLTLSKLEIKMTQFEELEEILEEERRNLESARVALVNERFGLKKMLDTVRAEVVRHKQAQQAATMNGGQSTQKGTGFSQSGVNAAMNPGMSLGSTGQGTVVSEVQAGQSAWREMRGQCRMDRPCS